jgi:hypothetical protein
MSADHFSVLWCSSDDVVQLLLAFTALSVGAAHKKLTAAGSGAATSSDSTSAGSSKHNNRRSSTAAAPLAADDVPASHLQLLAALSPSLHQQISRRNVLTPGADEFGSFNCNESAEGDEQHAIRLLTGLMCVLAVRRDILKNSNLVRRPVAGNSSSSSMPSGAKLQCNAVVPREQQLLLPLVLTVLELSLLLPAPQQGVMRMGLQVMPYIMGSAEFKPAAPGNAAAGAAPAAPSAHSDRPYTPAALMEALASPVCLQLGPAVMQYLREVPAAPSSTAASMQATLQGSNARDYEAMRDAFAIMATVIISKGEVLEGDTVLLCCCKISRQMTT